VEISPLKGEEEKKVETRETHSTRWGGGTEKKLAGEGAGENWPINWTVTLTRGGGKNSLKREKGV